MSFLIVLVVVSLGLLIGAISIFPGGIGVVESTMVLLYSTMGINFSAALLVAFLSRMIYYFFSIFVGGLSLIYLRMTINNK